MADSDDELWDQVDALSSMHLLSLSDRMPHEFCTPSLHFKDKTRTRANPGQGPFYVVTKGLKLGIYDDWNVASTFVTGVSGNAHARYSSWAQAMQAWRESCLPGNHQHPKDMQKPPKLAPGDTPSARSSSYHTPPQTPRKSSSVTKAMKSAPCPTATPSPPYSTIARPTPSPSAPPPPSTPSSLIARPTPSPSAPPPPSTPSSSTALFGVRIASPGRYPVIRVYEDRTLARAAYRRARGRGDSAQMLIGNDIEEVDFGQDSGNESR